MEYEVRPATPADAPGIARVARVTWKATYAETIAAHNLCRFVAQAYSTKALRAAIADRRGWFYVAVQQDTVVGYAQYVRRFDGQGELIRIYVHPDHQRRGIGRRLLVVGLLEIADAGLEHCYVGVEAGNRPARAFYEQAGFEGHRKYGRFLGDQILRLIEYKAPIARLLATPELNEIAERVQERK
jgi:ribosomal protein S18 acetylase RimI-like enzyme